ncbi:MAG: PIF1 family ATP-dependent DNA helicase [Methanobacterium sp.]
MHSWMKMSRGEKAAAYYAQELRTRHYMEKHLDRILNTDILAIDEISMMHPNFFIKMDEVLRLVRKKKEPFGGIQIIAFGDFYQLPPVIKEKDVFLDFCFETPLWKEANFQTTLLTKIYRQQGDATFAELLNRMRIGELTDADIRALASRELNPSDYPNDCLFLFPDNANANIYNINMLEELPTEEKTYLGEDSTTGTTPAAIKLFMDRLDKEVLAPKELVLKEEARVILLKNISFECGLVNGSMGTITSLGTRTISIDFDNGESVSIEKDKFEIHDGEDVVATREQFPLKLAYGLTIHKSQGMTLDKVCVDLKRVFADGQMYVGLSRCKTLEGTFLKGFNPNKVYVNPKVRQFYENLIREKTTA